MALTRGQTSVLRAIAANRNPDSYLAGSTPLNRDAPRISRDADIFHDRQAKVSECADRDAADLVAVGFGVRWTRREVGILAAVVSVPGEDVRLEWVHDGDYRFFPVVADVEFGYVLHVADLATNKVMAAAGRREPRDVVDLLHVHDVHLHLGAVAWAAVGRYPGFTPEGLLQEVARNATGYRRHDYASLASDPPVDADAVARRLREALKEAEDFVRRMPAGKEGMLFLDPVGRPTLPDPARLSDYVEHGGCPKGHWPGSSEISHEMILRT